MNPEPASPETILPDVRRAYRLLHDYQRWILDAVAYIGQQLDLTYEGGWPKYSDPSPRRGAGQLDYWAWDWLNLVLYDFHFTSPQGVHLSILLISDTGCFESADKIQTDPSTTAMLPVDQSKTLVALIVSPSPWPDPTYMNSNAGMKKFISEGLPEEYLRLGQTTLIDSVARLATVDTTNTLIDDLIQRASAVKLPLSRSLSSIR